MKNLIQIIEGLFDTTTKSSDTIVSSSLGYRGGVLDTTYNLYGEQRSDVVYAVGVRDGILSVNPPVGNIGKYTWRYMTPRSTKVPEAPSKLLDIHTIQFWNKFVYAVDQHGSQSLDGGNFVSKLVARYIEIFAKEVSNIELVSNQIMPGSYSVVSIRSMWPISLKNVNVDTDTLSFNTDGKLPSFANVSGRADQVRVYGTTITDDIAEGFDKLMDKEHVCEFDYNKHKQVKHLSFKKCLQAFNNPLKYRFYNCPFWFDNLSLNDFINVGNLNPEIVLIYNNNIQIVFFKKDRLCPINDINTNSYRMMGTEDRQKFAEMFPITTDGYRMIIAKRK